MAKPKLSRVYWKAYRQGEDDAWEGFRRASPKMPEYTFEEIVGYNDGYDDALEEMEKDDLD